MTTTRLIKSTGRSSRLALLLIPLVFACFAPTLQAQDQNTRFGVQALDSNTTGDKNTAVGFKAMTDNRAGSENTATGFQALSNNTNGGGNTGTGVDALRSNTTGSDNTGTGVVALRSNTTGVQNTATGAGALRDNIRGSVNTATGANALGDNTTGNFNTATGNLALFSNTDGNRNTALGDHAMFRNLHGSYNTANGNFALYSNTTGNFNVAIGDGAGSGVFTADDVICIGRGVAGANVSNTCFIGNIRGVTTQNANALPVVIDGAGQLGTVASSQRFKKDIATMNKASEAILALRPVTFHYKTDNEGTPQFGLIAEEVAKVNPALVLPDKEGKPYTVRYDAVNAMLLNEFLKEHRKVERQDQKIQEQEAVIAQLKNAATRQEAVNAEQQKRMEALTASLKEQAAQIQKVSAQVELSKSTPQTVLNSQ